MATEDRNDVAWDLNLQPGEELLWAAKKPHSVWMSTYVRWAVILFGSALFFASVAPRTLNVAEYCSQAPTLHCARDFWMMWPLAAVCTFCSGFIIRMIFISKNDKLPQRYAISSIRAFATTPRKPDQVRSIELRDKVVRETFFGKLRFGALKQGAVFFVGLDEIEIRAAMDAALKAGAKE